METKRFHYQPKCYAPNCGQPAVYKVAAPWSNGTSHELKNYGLACEAHRDSQLALAQIHRQGPSSLKAKPSAPSAFTSSTRVAATSS